MHPAARTLVDIAKSQDAEVGDGTTSVVLLAGELLKESKVCLRALGLDSKCALIAKRGHCAHCVRPAIRGGRPSQRPPDQGIPGGMHARTATPEGALPQYPLAGRSVSSSPVLAVLAAVAANPFSLLWQREAFPLGKVCTNRAELEAHRSPEGILREDGCGCCHVPGGRRPCSLHRAQWAKH